MPQSNTIEQQLESLHHAMQKAKQDGDTASYNNLVSMYNALVESLSVPLESSDDLPEEDNNLIPPNRKESRESNLAFIHVGITNILNGLVSNTMKGKYTEKDKAYFISLLQSTISKLNDIDANMAQEEKNKRKSKFSSISSRL